MAKGAERIAHIGIDELGIDECNIRQGIWDADQELIDSVRKIGVQEPLIVRTADPKTEKKYAVVCGSRRFNASIEAGKKTVPCIIRKLNDIDAMTLSMIENRQRAQTPTWMDIEYVGRIYHHYLKDELPQQLIISELFDKTGIGTLTLERYIRIYELPEEVKGLLREPEWRTTRQREYLKLFRTRELSRTLPIGHADLLTELREYPLEKQMEVAIFIISLSAELAEILIDRVNEYPDRDLDEVFGEVIEKEFRWVERILRFDEETWGALGDACVEKQMHYDDICVRIIKEWLKERGFLVPKVGKEKIERTMVSEVQDLFGGLKAHFEELEGFFRKAKAYYTAEELVNAVTGRGSIRCNLLPNWSIGKDGVCPRERVCEADGRTQDIRCALRLIRIARG